MNDDLETRAQSWSIPVLTISALVGGLIFYYGLKKKDTKLGHMATSLGATILFKVLQHPSAAEKLGPIQNLLQDQLATSYKLLA